jgi:hypothetical protein
MGLGTAGKMEESLVRRADTKACLHGKKAAPLEGCRFREPMVLYRLYIGGFGPSRAFFDLKPDSLAFIQAFEPGCIDAGVMDEKILAFILLNKAIALLIVEPLHGSFCHSLFLLS